MVKKVDYNQFRVLHHLKDSPDGIELAAFERICNNSAFGQLYSESLITVEDQHIVKITDAGRIAFEQFPILKMEENPQSRFHRKPLT